MRLSGCFSQFGSPGYHCVGRTRDKGEGYAGVELCYHRGTDPFYTSEAFHRAEGTEGIAVGDYPLREPRSDVPQAFNFLLAGYIQIQRSGRLGRSLLLRFPFRLPKAGPAGRIGRLYLTLERRPRSCVCGGFGVERTPGPGRGPKDQDNREEEEGFAFGRGRHMPTLSTISRPSSPKGCGPRHSLPSTPSGAGW